MDSFILFILFFNSFENNTKNISTQRKNLVYVITLCYLLACIKSQPQLQLN